MDEPFRDSVPVTLTKEMNEYVKKILRATCSGMDIYVLTLIESLEREVSSLKVERDAAVRDIEKIMQWDDTSVFCQFCKKDGECDLEYTDCAPEWCGPRGETT